MLSMLRTVNIEIPTEDQYYTKRKMDFSKSSLTNFSVKQQREEYSLKKETYGTTSSEDDINNDERSKESDKSSDNEGRKVEEQKTSVEESSDEEDEKRPSLIKSDAIQSYDILCGRDKATFNNVGNRRFRVLISLNIPRYEKATTKAEKASVIKYICNIFRNEVGVRFLKKHKTGEGYYELSVSEARKKVGHALRDMSVARQEVKKRREEMRRNSLRQQSEHNRSSQRMSGSMDFDPMFEPLPICEEVNRSTQNQQQQQQQQQPNMPAHWMDQQSKQSVIPNLLTQHLQQQQQSQRQAPQQQFTTVHQKLFDLQQQQQQLQQEREALVRQQQYQQELLEQQIRNRRLRNQQEQRQQQQQQQQNQPQQQNQEEGFHQFDCFFDAISQQQKRQLR